MSTVLVWGVIHHPVGTVRHFSLHVQGARYMGVWDPPRGLPLMASIRPLPCHAAHLPPRRPRVPPGSPEHLSRFLQISTPVSYPVSRMGSEDILSEKYGAETHECPSNLKHIYPTYMDELKSTSIDFASSRTHTHPPQVAPIQPRLFVAQTPCRQWCRLGWQGTSRHLTFPSRTGAERGVTCPRTKH